MSEYVYTDYMRDIDLASILIPRDTCLFCSSKMLVVAENTRVVPLSTGESDLKGFCEKLCEVCGWWYWNNFTEHRLAGTTHPGITSRHGAVGSLKEFDVSDQTLPIETVRSYLAAKYDARFEVDPLRFEDVVASVYRDIGYQARVTARRGDGGIDIVLDGPDQTTIGVQVKRYKETISVEQIRSFRGRCSLLGLRTAFSSLPQPLHRALKKQSTYRWQEVYR
jgi:restriction system protein